MELRRALLEGSRAVDDMNGPNTITAP